MSRLSLRQGLQLHIFEFASAAGWTLVGLAYLVDPRRTLVASPVGQTLPAALWIAWSVFEILGSVCAAYGLLTKRISFRVAGLALLATGVTMHGIAAAAAGLDLRDGIYLVNALACALRAITVRRLVFREETHA